MGEPRVATAFSENRDRSISDRSPFPHTIRKCAASSDLRRSLSRTWACPTRAFWFLNFPRRSRQIVLHCAHRATTALSWGLCEQEERSACSFGSFRGRVLPLSWSV